MIADIAAAIVKVRTSLGDSAAGKLQRGENLPKADGSTTIFFLQNFNIVPGSVFVTQDTSVRSQAGFTEDDINGIITFAVAPVATLTTFRADYNYYVATDAEYTEFINDALSMLGLDDVAAVPVGLESALVKLAQYGFFTKRATDYATRYNSNAGGAMFAVESVCANFTKLATANFNQGTQMRDDYYKRQGRRAAPASGSIAYDPPDYTPER